MWRGSEIFDLLQVSHICSVGDEMPRQMRPSTPNDSVIGSWIQALLEDAVTIYRAAIRPAVKLMMLRFVTHRNHG
jgi:hypothetical protein